MRDDAKALVPVIVPTYNTEKFLDQCLDSIQAQTYQNIEVICINDGSTDGTLDIMRRHAAADARVRVIDKPNGGYGQGCNRGIAEARGRWVAIVEPDDYIDPGMFEDMLTLASRFDEPIDIVKTPWYDLHRWNEPDRMRADACLLTGRLKTSERPFTLAEHPLLIEYHPAIWSAIYRRDFLLEHDIRFPEYPGAGWADNPFLVETLCQARTILYLDQPYYRYRADLPGSTKNHTSEEAVRRPFDRWIAMTDVMERIGVVDEGIWKSHYVRGFNYVTGAIHDDGADNPIVQDGAKRVFERMDERLVLSNSKISRSRKRFYCEVLGKPAYRGLNLAHVPHVLGNVVFRLRYFGARRTFKRLVARVTGNPDAEDA